MGSDPSEEKIRVPRPGDKKSESIVPIENNEKIESNEEPEPSASLKVEPPSPIEEAQYTIPETSKTPSQNDDDLFSDIDNKPTENSDNVPDFLKAPNTNRPKLKTDSLSKSSFDTPSHDTPSDDDLFASSGDDDLFGDLLEEETMEDILSDFKDVYVVAQEGQKPILAGPIIDILKKQGYIKGDLETEEELQKVPEYEVLMLIIKNHPIPLTELEEKTEIESLSLVLSNLQADKLIEYTNDYRWTISSTVKETLIEFISKSKESEEEDKRESLEEAKLRRSVHRNTKFERQFVMGMYKIGIIDDLDLPLHEYLEVPEFAILKNVKDREPLAVDLIQRELHEIPPVQVKGIISRLEGMGYIQKDLEERYELSDKMVRMLVGEHEF